MTTSCAGVGETQPSTPVAGDVGPAPARCLHPDACLASRSAYVQGCRGEACRAANATAKREAKRARQRPDAIPTPATVPAGIIRTHLRELRGAGVGVRTIAQAAGVSEATVKDILRYPSRRVRLETRERLLAVMPSDVAPFALLVPSAPVVEDLDLLRGAGWGPIDLARLVHGRDTPKRSVQLGARVRRSTAEKVRRAVEAEFPPDLGAMVDDPLVLFRSLLTEHAWKVDGECRRLSPDVKKRQRPFFPTRGEVALGFSKRICAGCAVIEPCLAAALQGDEQGVWGGTTGDDRREIRALGLSAAEVLAMHADAPGVPLMDLLNRVRDEPAA